MKQISPLKNSPRPKIYNSESFFKIMGKDIILKTKVIPNSSDDELMGVINGQLKIALSAPAVEGKANKKCIDFLAKYFKVAKSRIEIISGLKSKEKIIKIYDLNKESFLEKIAKSI